MKTEQGRIVNSGMGGFLNPPGHPEHTLCVETDLCRPADDRSRMSLSTAVKAEWLDHGVRTAAEARLTLWHREHRKPMCTPEVRDWVHQVLGYFVGCYQGDETLGEASWYASNLRIWPKADPMLNADIHAGVHLIRQYYPEYTPCEDDFRLAYWGTKPA